MYNFSVDKKQSYLLALVTVNGSDCRKRHQVSQLATTVTHRRCDLVRARATRAIGFCARHERGGACNTEKLGHHLLSLRAANPAAGT